MEETDLKPKPTTPMEVTEEDPGQTSTTTEQIKEIIGAKPSGSKQPEAKPPTPPKTEAKQTSGKKHLSGAQSRKLAIEAAKARGEPIRPRKPRANRQRKELGATKNPEPNSDPKKRARQSEGSTPSPSVRRDPKKIREDGDRTKPGTSASGQSYSQSISAIKMAITLQTYPEGKLTPDQAKQIQQTLTKEIFKCEAGTGPQFTNSYEHGGVLFVSCANETSKEWLVGKLPQLQVWEGANLRIGAAKDVVKTSKVIVWIPTDLVEAKESTKILPLLKTQNSTLLTEEWRIISSRSEQQGTTLVLALSESSLKELSKVGFKAYLGLSQITFRVSKKAEEKAEDAEGNTDKPSA